jgi:hypothetical protein
MLKFRLPSSHQDAESFALRYSRFKIIGLFGFGQGRIKKWRGSSGRLALPAPVGVLIIQDEGRANPPDESR